MKQTIVSESDSRINYSQGWSSVPGPLGPERTTFTYGQSFNFRFNVSEGGTVEVHGGLHPSPNSSIVLKSVYDVDNQDQFMYTASWVAHSTPVASFYNSSPLSAGSHTLFVSMLSNNPYFFDFIQINDPLAGADPASSASSSATPTASQITSSASSVPVAAIVVTSFGSLALLASLIVAAFLLRRRQHRRRSRLGLVPPSDSGESCVDPFTETASTSVLAGVKGRREVSSLNRYEDELRIPPNALVGSTGVICLETGQIVEERLAPPAYE
ncbi:hypothetical protein B0H17DRAFT_1193610 [Mycena rosella]|uniref:Uncharacterized protein n=1 Tax=Mycena rosella TaxID=1033263 RepID=A0AAD7GSM1_MYCRO|nr:hypothetical protein B0H17DRAFT_1193610 [Mycena rosella]